MYPRGICCRSIYDSSVISSWPRGFLEKGLCQANEFRKHKIGSTSIFKWHFSQSTMKLMLDLLYTISHLRPPLAVSGKLSSFSTNSLYSNGSFISNEDTELGARRSEFANHGQLLGALISYLENAG